MHRIKADFEGKYSAPFIEDHAFVFGWDGAYSKRNEHRLQTDIVTPGSGLVALPLNENYDADVTRRLVCTG
jgi:hypothetical protein